MNIDMLIDGILDSYDRYGLINRNHTEDFPNRQNVVSILSDIQSVVFPGFRAAEDIDSVNIRYVIGQKVLLLLWQVQVGLLIFHNPLTYF